MRAAVDKDKVIIFFQFGNNVVIQHGVNVLLRKMLSTKLIPA